MMPFNGANEALHSYRRASTRLTGARQHLAADRAMGAGSRLLSGVQARPKLRREASRTPFRPFVLREASPPGDSRRGECAFDREANVVMPALQGAGLSTK